MDRSQKADLVAELKQVFAETGVVVVTRNLGLTVAQSGELRAKMRDAGAQFKVAKNRLAKIALEGSDYSPIAEFLTGPTAIASSVDPVAADFHPAFSRERLLIETIVWSAPDSCFP